MGDLSSVPILDVWRALGGPEPKRGRAPAWWRGGDNPQAVSLNEEKGCWHDFRDHSGGGVLALVETVLDCDRATALAWLEAERLIERRSFNRDERRGYKRQHQTASVVAREIEHWRAALAEELNERKVSAVEIGDYEGLEPAAQRCYLLENGAPVAVAWEFFGQRKRDPEGTARLIEAGRQFEDESRWFAAALIAARSKAAPYVAG
jgi:hypothetical protein